MPTIIIINIIRTSSSSYSIIISIVIIEKQNLDNKYSMQNLQGETWTRPLLFFTDCCYQKEETFCVFVWIFSKCFSRMSRGNGITKFSINSNAIGLTSEYRACSDQLTERLQTRAVIKNKIEADVKYLMVFWLNLQKKLQLTEVSRCLVDADQWLTHRVNGHVSSFYFWRSIFFIWSAAFRFQIHQNEALFYCRVCDDRWLNSPLVWTSSLSLCSVSNASAAAAAAA